MFVSMVFFKTIPKLSCFWGVLGKRVVDDLHIPYFQSSLLNDKPFVYPKLNPETSVASPLRSTTDDVTFSFSDQLLAKTAALNCLR